ncbi:hypothetical protein LL965_14085 [Xanthomonas cassavae CFBP 4642]|uniref:Uncharacterized protein n=1 Tax=Xanthomonas cassavae CFBP 4642 TaxID=1219375 RepID=A0ABS8HHR2_9XANT|nr:hypothetical protein [Xanthomonas cassavae]MCC4621162.1 hypothetical protein [Xanthomonas cassavae CFBP 4642]
MSLPHAALETNLDPVDSAAGKCWRVMDQAMVMLKCGSQLTNKHGGQQRTFYMVVTTA